MTTSNYFPTEPLRLQFLRNTLSEERTRMSFIISVGLRQRSHSQVWAPRDSWPYFTVLDSRLPQTGGLGPRIHIPAERGWPGYNPGHWVPFSSPVVYLTLESESESDSYVATDGLSASLSRNKAPIWVFLWRNWCSFVGLSIQIVYLIALAFIYFISILLYFQFFPNSSILNVA
jgi:hypothetical protein